MTLDFGGRVRGSTENGRHYEEEANFFLGGEGWRLSRVNRMLFVTNLVADKRNIYCKLDGGVERKGVDEVLDCLLGCFNEIYSGFREHDLRGYLQESISQYRAEAHID